MLYEEIREIIREGNGNTGIRYRKDRKTWEARLNYKSKVKVVYGLSSYDECLNAITDLRFKILENQAKLPVTDVKFYEGYFIFPNGQVFTQKCNEIQPWTDRIGYLRIRINGKVVSHHRFIAKAFLENPNNYREVNHIDGNKSNNNISNLEWCTHSQNIYHRRDVLGTHNNVINKDIAKEIKIMLKKVTEILILQDILVLV